MKTIELTQNEKKKRILLQVRKLLFKLVAFRIQISTQIKANYSRTISVISKHQHTMSLFLSLTTSHNWLQSNFIILFLINSYNSWLVVRYLNSYIKFEQSFQINGQQTIIDSTQIEKVADTSWCRADKREYNLNKGAEALNICRQKMGAKRICNS